MRVLIVCSGNRGQAAPFITEQAESLQAAGVEIEFFLVRGNGTIGYLTNLQRLRRQIRTFRPDLLHAHYGLSGLLAGLQREVPVITTYHGSDINNRKVRPLSQLAMRLSRHNIFVSSALARRAGATKRFSIIPCGVDIPFFHPVPAAEARAELGLDPAQPLILFAGAFSTPVKNAPLARAAVSRIPGARLIELAGYSRREVMLLLNACNVLLMTSLNEGSPQIVKEALACNCPVVSTDVGDVAARLNGIDGCFVTGDDPAEIAARLQSAIGVGRAERAMETVAGLDLKAIASGIISIYSKLG